MGEIRESYEEEFKRKPIEHMLKIGKSYKHHLQFRVKKMCTVLQVSTLFSHINWIP
jgi:hypothetical protein